MLSEKRKYERKRSDMKRNAREAKAIGINERSIRNKTEMIKNNESMYDVSEITTLSGVPRRFSSKRLCYTGRCTLTYEQSARYGSIRPPCMRSR